MAERVRAAETPASNGPSQADFEGTLSEYTELKTASQRLAQKMKTALAAYENKGGDVDEIKFAHKMAKLDKGEARAKVQRMNRAAVWSGIIEYEANGQANFTATFTEAPKKQSTEAGARLARARAHADGYNSGKSGGSIDASPFNDKPGSEEFVAWRDGWNDGHDDYVLTHPDEAAAAADTSKVKPARKAKEDAAPAAPKTPRKPRGEAAAVH